MNNHIPWQRRQLIPLLLGMLLSTVCLFLFASDGSTQTSPATVEAETMTLTTNRGYPQNDSTASGGQHLKIWGNDVASKTVMLLGSADKIMVKARGDRCRGAPHMLVKVNDTTVIDKKVSATTWTTYSANLSSPVSGSTSLEVVFDNDYVRSGCDRNLYVDNLDLSGSPPPAPPPAPTLVTGIYDGWHDTAGVNAHFSWLGGADGYQGIQQAHEFMDHQTWADFDNASSHFGGWKTWVEADNVNRRFSVSMPLLTFSNDKQFAACASGSFDSHFASVATYMHDTALEDTIIRLGWEMNGNGPYANGWPWSIAGQNLADYKACYQRAVTTMNNIEPSLEFEWEPNVTKDAARLTLEQMYPGDAYVDYIGLGLYDYCTFTCTSDTVDGRWNMLQDPETGVAEDNGMLHHKEFAAAHAKPMTYTEYGLWEEPMGGGDNPEFIRRMSAWMSFPTTSPTTSTTTSSTTIYHYTPTRDKRTSKSSRGNEGG